MGGLEGEAIEAMRVVDLRTALKQRGLPTGGKKAEVRCARARARGFSLSGIVAEGKLTCSFSLPLLLGASAN
jgi:hypothetical protein